MLNNVFDHTCERLCTKLQPNFTVFNVSQNAGVAKLKIICTFRYQTQSEVEYKRSLSICFETWVVRMQCWNCNIHAFC